MTTDNGRHADARLESVRRWLEQIVATLPEPRQRMYDLFVARGLDSWSAALELGTGVAEVRRLRHENREAILRAFEVTALAAAEGADDEPWSETPGCGEVRQIMAAAQHDGDQHWGRSGHFVVLPADLRVILSRHVSQCTACQDWCDDCLASWAPELLAILGDIERHEHVMQDTRSMPELAQRGPAPGAHRRAGRARNAVVRRGAATGAGLLVALPLLAFVWPGFFHGQQSSAARSPQAFTNSAPSSGVAPHVTGTSVQVAGSKHGQPAPGRTSGVSSRLSPSATGSTTAQAYSQPSVFYTVQPSPTPTPSLIQRTSPPTSAPATPSPSASAQKSKKPSPTPSPVTSTTPASPAPSATPTPSVTPSTPASATPSSTAPASPDPTASASAPAASAASPSPTATPSASATS